MRHRVSQGKPSPLCFFAFSSVMFLSSPLLLAAVASFLLGEGAVVFVLLTLETVFRDRGIEDKKKEELNKGLDSRGEISNWGMWGKEKQIWDAWEDSTEQATVSHQLSQGNKMLLSLAPHRLDSTYWIHFDNFIWRTVTLCQWLVSLFLLI